MGQFRGCAWQSWGEVTGFSTKTGTEKRGWSGRILVKLAIVAQGHRGKPGRQALRVGDMSPGESIRNVQVGDPRREERSPERPGGQATDTGGARLSTVWGGRRENTDKNPKRH